MFGEADLYPYPSPRSPRTLPRVERLRRPAFQVNTPPHRGFLRSYLLCLLSASVLLATPLQAVARGKTENKWAPAQSKQTTAADFAVPSAESIVIMTRTVLLGLNDAVRTGNYTVFRDVASPSFREANSVRRLRQIFSSLSAQGMDLAAVAILPFNLPQAPAIDQNKRLHILGYFPGEPIQLNFELVFEAVANQWRLYGISVVPTKSASPATRTPTRRPNQQEEGSPAAK